MQYQGGKSRLAKHIVPELLKYMQPGDAFVDLFAGGCNVVAAVPKEIDRYAFDHNEAVMRMWHELCAGRWMPPTSLSEDEYAACKAAWKSGDRSALIGFVGAGCSFAGKWFGGYARNAKNKNYCAASARSALKKSDKLRGVRFGFGDYREQPIPEKALIYCDIPYKDTISYAACGAFDHEAFYAWAASRPQRVIVSEYAKNVPPGARVIWRKTSKSTAGLGASLPTEEVLYTWDKDVP